MDDALLFSLDFSTAKAEDCFDIIDEEDSFSLKAKKNLICGTGSKPNVALAVSSHGMHDVIVVLGGNGIYWFPMIH